MTEPHTPPPAEPVIRITAREAGSAHVDDLLRRQADMRGETGMKRDRRTPWYLRSWLILLLAGGIGAFLAWAIIEPNFDDCAYDQAKIVSFTPSDFLSDASDPAVAKLETDPDAVMPAHGLLLLRDQKIVVTNRTHDITTHQPVTVGDLAVGREIGVYADPLPQGEDGHPTKRDHAGGQLWFARFVDLHPAKAAPDLPDLTHSATRSASTSLVIFALTAALIGLFIGAADGLVCRLWTRAAIAGLVGLGVGFLGGFLASILANLAYAPLTKLAEAHMDQAGHFTGFGLLLQMISRTLAWGLAGVAMGLGQGIALRSRRLLLFGLLGGVVGGLLGGLVFDPLDLLLLGYDKPSAHLSRMVGFVVIGCSVGAMIGVVELLARDAWLRMDEGPLAGKEFLVFKDVMKVGASPRSDIYLFNDDKVQAHHATLRAVGEEIDLESQDKNHQALVNELPVQRVRLRHGDRIAIGRAVFTFRRRSG